MSEGVVITIQLVVTPEEAGHLAEVIPKSLKYAERSPGFRSAEVVRHRDEANRFLIIEHWDSEAHFEAYQEWRGDRAEFAANGHALLAYDYDAWPYPVASA